MVDKMRIWEAVSKTDPRHTKQVEFGRRFTSIDAHWQIMQATKLFGPIGEGWGYGVQHGTLTMTAEMILAVADVTLWWLDQPANGGLGARREYGPIRATCEMYGPKTYRSKITPGEFVCDEDAPKKALTDALTKGLSHLGFSADVFLGLFDDNRYVQRMQREFASGGVPTGGVAGTAGGGTDFRPERRGGTDWVGDAQRDGIVDTTREKGKLPTKGAGREATPEQAREAKIVAATNKRIDILKSQSAWTRDGLDQFWNDNKTWIVWMADPTNKALKEHDRFIDAFNEAEMNIRPVDLA